jgi:hypothetical protein
MIHMTFPDVTSFEIAKNLSKDIGLQFILKIGPDDEALEGFRMVQVIGLPDRIAMLQDLFALKMLLHSREKQKYVGQLEKLWQMN